MLDFVRKSKKRVWITVVAFFIALISILFIAKNQFHLGGVQNLGPEIEFLEEKSYGGCVLFYCEGPVGSTYYFQTDIDPEALQGVFSNSKLIRQENQEYPAVSSGYEYVSVWLELDNGKELVVEYFKNPDFVASEKRLSPIKRTYLIKLSEFNYNLARNALRK